MGRVSRVRRRYVWPIALIGFGVIAYVTLTTPLAKLTPALLTADIADRSWAGLSAEFDRRVRARFPIGMADTDMGAELSREGFVRQDWETRIDAAHKARRREDNGICKQAAYVYWRADEGGHLTAVRGEYREEACL